MQLHRPTPPRRLRITGLALACIALAVPALALAAAPTASTEAVDAETIEKDYVLLSGTINPNGIATSYFFQYGPTAEYGQNTPTIPIGSGKNDVGVDVGVDGLTPSTLYHYRIVAVYTPTKDYTAGATYGADQTFTTLAPPAALALTIANPTAVKVDGRAASFSLACTGPAGKTCAGKLALKAKVKLPRDSKAKLQGLGKVLFHLKTGKTKTAKFTLPQAVADAVAKSGKFKAIAKTKTRLIKAPVTTKVTLVPAG